MVRPPHIEITEEDMRCVAGGSLVAKGWEASEKDGEVVFNRPGSFGSRNVCLGDALQVQKMIERWGQDG